MTGLALWRKKNVKLDKMVVNWKCKEISVTIKS